MSHAIRVKQIDKEINKAYQNGSSIFKLNVSLHAGYLWCIRDPSFLDVCFAILSVIAAGTWRQEYMRSHELHFIHASNPSY